MGETYNLSRNKNSFKTCNGQSNHLDVKFYNAGVTYSLTAFSDSLIYMFKQSNRSISKNHLHLHWVTFWYGSDDHFFQVIRN